MSTNKSLTSLLIVLWHKLKARRKQQLIGLVLLMVLASFAEVLSIGVLFPFLGMLSAPEKMMTYSSIQTIASFLDIQTPIQMLFTAMILFIISVIIAGIIRLTLLYTNTRFSYAVGADLSLDVYRRALYEPYSVHIGRNSSEIINAINGKTAMIIGSILVPLMTLISASILFSGIFIAVLAIDASIAVGLSLLFGLIYFLILHFTKNSLQKNSECIARESNQVIKSLQEGLGGIRDVLLDGSQEVFCKIYQQADLLLRHAQGNNSFISASPRFLIEMIGMILVASMAYYLSKINGGDEKGVVIPVLGALALGAQRILPVLQQAYSSLAIIRGAKSSLSDVLVMLNQPLPDTSDKLLLELTSFNRSIALQNIGFSYSKDAVPVLRGINFEILKGQRIGFIGTTGAGKSTLLDVIMGLLHPSEGVLLIDGQPIDKKNIRNWQRCIAHVPQSIFLADSSVEENIAFGVPLAAINHDRVKLAASHAQISDVIESWPLQYKTKIGERGIRLSGGQRQRIGIARALYKQAKVIILDEATSALDGNTERTVMGAIDELHEDLTVLIIAHRLTTLKNCDLVIELENGMIKRVGPYSNLVNI